MDRFDSIQTLIHEMRSRGSINEICNRLGVSKGSFLYLLQTSDKNLRRFRPEFAKQIIGLAIEMGIPTDALPNDAQRLISLDGRSVFLCHSTEDKEAVRDVYFQLRNDGLNPWLDEKSLRAGQDWKSEINKAIRNSIAVIVCLSTKSIDKTGFVQKEIRIALDAADERPEGTIYVIPVRLEECPVPDRLSHLHYVDIFAEGGYENLVSSLDDLCHPDNATS